MPEFVFRDEPPAIPPRGRAVKWQAEAEACRQNPGRWLLLCTSKNVSTAQQTAYAIRHMSRAAFSEPRVWDARHSGLEVWVSYRGLAPE